MKQSIEDQKRNWQRSQVGWAKQLMRKITGYIERDSLAP